MTKTIRFGAAGIAMFAALGMSSAAFAQDNTAEATARAEVLTALNLSLSSGSLDFGAIVVDGADTLVLQPDGTMDCANKNVVCSGTTDTPEFLAEGTADQTVTVNLPTSAVTISLGGTGTAANEQMTITDFTTSATDDEVVLTGGDGSFTVGGTLNIGADQVAGIYTGEFTVSVDYL